MIDGSRKVTYWVCAGGILAVTACTSYMNARYGYSQGHDVYEKWVFVIAGVSTDLIKVFGLPFAAIAWAKNFKTKAVFAFTMWLGVFLYALSNAAGFALTARVNKNAEQAFDNDSTKQTRTEYMAAFAALEKLREDQDVHKTNQRYLSTAGCTSPENRMTVESRMFCTQYIVHIQKIVEKEKEVESLKKNLPEAKFERTQNFNRNSLGGVCPPYFIERIYKMINKITRKEHPEFFQALEEDWPVVDESKEHRRGSTFYIHWILKVDDEYFADYPQFHGHCKTNDFIWSDSDYDNNDITELTRVEKKTKTVETTQWVAVK